MKIYFLAAILVIQLCSSSGGDSNRENSRHMNGGDTAASGTSSAEHRNTSRSASVDESENLFFECPGTPTKDFGGSVEQNVDDGTWSDAITNYIGEQYTHQMAYSDLYPPSAVQGQDGTNEIDPQNSSGYFIGDGHFFVNMSKIFKDKILPSIPHDHPSYNDPSYKPVFTSLPLSEASGDSVNESHAVSSSGKERKESDDIELIPVSSDEDRPRKRRKIMKKMDQDDDYKLRKSRHEALESRKKLFEECIKSNEGYKEWKEKLRIKMGKQDEELNGTTILLEVLDALDLINGENPKKRATESAINELSSSSLEAGEEHGQQKTGRETDIGSHHDTSLYLVKFGTKQRCEKDMVLQNDLLKVAESDMSIDFGTRIFYSLFESSIRGGKSKKIDYTSLIKAVTERVLPKDSLARRKYGYLRNALREAKIKVIQAKVGVTYTLLLDNEGCKDTLKLPRFTKGKANAKETIAGMIEFTGVSRVVYSIRSDDLYYYSMDIECTQQYRAEYKKGIATRISKHKEIVQWLEEQNEKEGGKEANEAKGAKDKIEYYIVITPRAGAAMCTTDEGYRGLLEQQGIISKGSRVKVMTESTFQTNYGMQLPRLRRAKNKSAGSGSEFDTHQ